MAFINKHDTNGTKGALAEGEFGYDKQGSDRGRVYIGTNSGNKPLATKSEVDANTTAIAGKAAIGTSYTKTESDTRYLGKTAKASDSDKLDGLDSSAFARQKATSTVYGGAKMSLSGTTLTITTI